MTFLEDAESYMLLYRRFYEPPINNRCFFRVGGNYPEWKRIGYLLSEMIPCPINFRDPQIGDAYWQVKGNSTLQGWGAYRIEFLNLGFGKRWYRMMLHSWTNEPLARQHCEHDLIEHLQENTCSCMVRGAPRL